MELNRDRSHVTVFWKSFLLESFLDSILDVQQGSTLRANNADDQLGGYDEADGEGEGKAELRPRQAGPGGASLEFLLQQYTSASASLDVATEALREGWGLAATGAAAGAAGATTSNDIGPNGGVSHDSLEFIAAAKLGRGLVKAINNRLAVREPAWRAVLARNHAFRRVPRISFQEDRGGLTARFDESECSGTNSRGGLRAALRAQASNGIR